VNPSPLPTVKQAIVEIGVSTDVQEIAQWLDAPLTEIASAIKMLRNLNKPLNARLASVGTGVSTNAPLAVCNPVAQLTATVWVIPTAIRVSVVGGATGVSMSARPNALSTVVDGETVRLDLLKGLVLKNKLSTRNKTAFV